MDALSSNHPELLIGLASLVLTFVATIATICIPVLLARFASSENRRMHELQTFQLRALEDQRTIHQRQRRDVLMDKLGALTDPVQLTLAWREVAEFGADDQALLRRTIRSNPQLGLPGSTHGLEPGGNLDDAAIAAYIDGMQARYSKPSQYKSFPGFGGFVAQIKGDDPEQFDAYIGRLVDVLTGPAAEQQRPSHQFFRDTVCCTPQFAPPLLYSIEHMPYARGGLRLNVLTGVLLALVDSIEKRDRSAHFSAHCRANVRAALAWLLHRHVIRSLDHWNLDGSSEPVSATVAWLIRVAGWAVDEDSHIDMRIVSNLHYSIRSIPAADRGWGIDAEDVAAGFAEIERKAPGLWAEHGHVLMQSADEIGPWTADS